MHKNIFSDFVKDWLQPFKAANPLSLEVVIYEPNNSFINITAAETAMLSMVMSNIKPLVVYGYERPTSMFITEGQYLALPSNIAAYFTPRKIELQGKIL